MKSVDLLSMLRNRGAKFDDDPAPEPTTEEPKKDEPAPETKPEPKTEKKDEPVVKTFTQAELDAAVKAAKESVTLPKPTQSSEAPPATQSTGAKSYDKLMDLEGVEVDKLRELWKDGTVAKLMNAHYKGGG